MFYIVHITSQELPQMRVQYIGHVMQTKTHDHHAALLFGGSPESKTKERKVLT